MPPKPIKKPGADSSFPGGRIITHGESPLEAMVVRNGLLGPKSHIRIGTWNVRTMWELSRTDLPGNEKLTVDAELEEMRLSWSEAQPP